MKKLLLLAVGGTIASVKGEDGLTPGMTPDELISCLPIATTSSHYRVESKLLMNIDSTNMQPELWAKIAEAIYEHYPSYDGFVITHGTDTMAYTSSALSFMLRYLGKPVVLTGSQVPLCFDKTDGKRNIADALRFACEPVGGVYVVFDGRVIAGTRAMKMRTKSYDAFESINHPYIAFVNGAEVKYNRAIPSASGELELDTSICPDVFILKLSPGTKPELFDSIKNLYRGVIIECFGSGGVPFYGRNLLPKIKELIDFGVAVVITTQCLEEGEDLTIYEVGRRVAQNAVILSGDMNTEAIVPKLMWALGKTKNLLEVKMLMETSIANEITAKKIIAESWA